MGATQTAPCPCSPMVASETTKNFQQRTLPRLKVIGVGGGGSNAVNRMIACRRQRCRFHSCQHRCAGAPQVRCAHTHPHRRQANQGPRLGWEPRDRQARRRREQRRIVRSSEGRGHGLHHRRYGWWYRHRRIGYRRLHCPRNRRAHSGRRHQALPL